MRATSVRRSGVRGVTQYSVTQLNTAQEHRDTQDKPMAQAQYTKVEQEKMFLLGMSAKITTNVLHVLHALI